MKVTTMQAEIREHLERIGILEKKVQTLELAVEQLERVLVRTGDRLEWMVNKDLPEGVVYAQTSE